MCLRKHRATQTHVLPFPTLYCDPCFLGVSLCRSMCSTVPLWPAVRGTHRALLLYMKPMLPPSTPNALHIAQTRIPTYTPPACVEFAFTSLLSTPISHNVAERATVLTFRSMVG